MAYLLQIIQIALNSIKANKLRTVLTTLGIIIGISAVIAMLSIGQGAQALILQQVQGLGSNTITIIPVANFKGPTNQVSIAAQLKNKLDKRVVSRFNTTNFPEISAIAPIITTTATAVAGPNSKDVSVYGVTEQYFVVQASSLSLGHSLSSADATQSRKVIVLGSSVAAKLFGESDSIGKNIRVNNLSVQVIGVLGSKGGGQDDRVYLPISLVGAQLVGSQDFSQLVIQVQDENLIDSVATKIDSELKDFYKVTNGKDGPFTLFTSKEFLTLASTVTGVFTTLLASIASISLVVGGIGIMNIMLVSVTERTKEIGLRKAVGAKRRAILLQFLIEAVILTLIGGIIGISLGLGIGLLISAVGNIPAVVSWQAIALATSVSALIGVIFGFYPAYRASRLNPIDALRYE